MSYWVPSAILILVLLVLIAQLPWRSPTRGNDYLRKNLHLGRHENMPEAPAAEEQKSGKGRAAFKS